MPASTRARRLALASTRPFKHVPVPGRPILQAELTGATCPRPSRRVESQPHPGDRHCGRDRDRGGARSRQLPHTRQRRRRGPRRDDDHRSIGPHHRSGHCGRRGHPPEGNGARQRRRDGQVAAVRGSAVPVLQELHPQYAARDHRRVRATGPDQDRLPRHCVPRPGFREGASNRHGRRAPEEALGGHRPLLREPGRGEHGLGDGLADRRDPRRGPRARRCQGQGRRKERSGHEGDRGHPGARRTRSRSRGHRGSTSASASALRTRFARPHSSRARSALLSTTRSRASRDARTLPAPPRRRCNDPAVVAAVGASPTAYSGEAFATLLDEALGC